MHPAAGLNVNTARSSLGHRRVGTLGEGESWFCGAVWAVFHFNNTGARLPPLSHSLGSLPTQSFFFPFLPFEEHLSELAVS